MEWYLRVVRDNFANFNGRARRKEYWMFVLFNMIFSTVAYGLDNMLGTMFISGVYSLAVLIPLIAVSVRRLHDIGKSGWWFLLMFIPFGIFVLIYFFVLEGDSGRNQYGNSPK